MQSTDNFGMVNTLAHRCLWLCSSCIKLNTELLLVKQFFLKNGYPENFINECFKNFMDNIHLVKETTLTVEKKSLPSLSVP